MNTSPIPPLLTGAAGAALCGSALEPVSEIEPGLVRHVVAEVRRRAPPPLNPRPHQGERERQRRLRQMAKA